MAPNKITPLDFVGVIGAAAVQSGALKTALEIGVLVITAAAMAPLAFWRVRALWREYRTGQTQRPPSDEGR
ncbi:MAG: hypothetical protein NDI75_07585 [Candidatus Didemnitutus sp.]|nr:hypothetical protein [Candidatus Didemnitutus sp.]